MQKRILILVMLGLALLNVSGQISDYILYEKDYGVPVTSLEVSPDGKMLLVGDQIGDLNILDAVSYKELAMFESVTGSAILDIEITPKQDVIFLASGNLINLINRDGASVATWNIHNTTIWSMDLNPQGTRLVSAEMNKTFQLWDVYNGEVIQSMRGHDEPTLAVCFSPDGKQFASGSADKLVHLWDITTREIVETFQGLSNDIYDVAISPDGKLIAACSKDHTIRIWDIGSNKLKHLLKGHRDMVMEIEFSEDGCYLLSASADFAIKLWDVNSGQEIYAYLDNEAAVIDIAFLPGSESFASASMDNKMKIRALDHEIFVLKYYGDDYEKAIAEDPLFLPRQKGEKRSEHELRLLEAAKKRSAIVEKYYHQYIEARERGIL
jgi:WD40 repeat protein